MFHDCLTSTDWLRSAGVVICCRPLFRVGSVHNSCLCQNIFYSAGLHPAGHPGKLGVAKCFLACPDVMRQPPEGLRPKAARFGGKV